MSLADGGVRCLQTASASDAEYFNGITESNIIRGLTISAHATFKQVFACKTANKFCDWPSLLVGVCEWEQVKSRSRAGCTVAPRAST